MQLSGSPRNRNHGCELRATRRVTWRNNLRRRHGVEGLSPGLCTRDLSGRRLWAMPALPTLRAVDRIDFGQERECPRFKQGNEVLLSTDATTPGKKHKDVDQQHSALPILGRSRLQQYLDGVL